MPSLTAYLPPALLRAVARAQFRVPAVRWALKKANRRLTEGERVIAHGIGKGLKFDATGGYPGYSLGTTEPHEQQALAEHLPAGGVLYDLGANIGFFSTLAARLVGPQGHVYAFEPSADSAARARENAERNHFANVTVIPAAVSDHTGRMLLDTSSDTAKHRLDPHGTVEVDVVSLDDWATTKRPPDVVMIDIEGAELDALRGMRNLLAEHKPVILCEVHSLGQTFLDYVSQELPSYRLEGLEGPIRSDAVRWHAVLTPTT